MEHVTWGWHPIYHIMTIVPLLQTILPPVPLTHNKHEVHIMVVAIRNMENTNPLWPTPFIVILLKTFMFAQGIGQILVDLIKVGSKGNIFEWMQVGFNVHLWCVVKRMLHEEGFFLFKVVWMFLFHAKMEKTCGSGIWNIERPHGALVGSIHCLDIFCPM